MFKKIKDIIRRLKTLEDRMLKVEQQQIKTWEETHPRTMGGK